MKLCTLFFIAFLLSYVSMGQNLVPNPGFENYAQCPTSLSGIAYTPGYNTFNTVYGWISPLSLTTPDYFNACATGVAGVPHNIFGYKQPHTGHGYAGIIAFQGGYIDTTLANDYREYIECKLQHPLQAGEQYCLSFYVSTSISDSGGLFNYVCLNRIGLNLSKIEVLNNTDRVLNLPYSMQSALTIQTKDTGGWVRVAGTYTATGGEQWLTIGCFDTLPAFAQLYPAVRNPALSVHAYLFIDDISLYDMSFADTVQNVHNTVLCDSLQATLAATSTATSYLWSNNATTPTIIINDTGTYWCVGHGTDCTITIDTFHIQYKPFKKLSLGNDSVNCQNAPITIKANNEYDSYLWNTGATNDSIVTDTTGLFVLAVTDGCGRVQTDSMHVFIQPPTAAPVVSDTAICEFVKNAIINVQGEHVRWYYTPSLHNGLPVQPPLSTTDTGTFIFYVTQTIGACESPAVPVHIAVKYKPQTQPLIEKTICDNDTLQLGMAYSDLQYLWNTGDTTCCISCTKAGLYILNINNDCGQAADSTNLTVSDCNNCIVMPNAFTPNHDGVNDLLKPIVFCPIKKYSIEIFNRWGQMVYSTQNLNATWDGTVNGAPVPDGVYVYVLDYTSETTDNAHRLTGNIMLMR